MRTIATDVARSVSCLSVVHTTELCEIGWTDRDAFVFRLTWEKKPHMRRDAYWRHLANRMKWSMWLRWCGLLQKLAIIIVVGRTCLPVGFPLLFVDVVNIYRELGDRDYIKISVFDQKKILGTLEDSFLGCVTLLPADIKRHLDGGCKHSFSWIYDPLLNY